MLVDISWQLMYHVGVKKTRDINERFDEKWRLDSSSGCWMWLGFIKPNGYGQFSDRYKRFYPHRWAYERKYGKIPEGMVLDHFVCEVRRCVNPDHVRPVTHRENLLRGDTITATNAAKTRCVNGHDYTPDNTYIDGKRSRSCKTCRKQALMEYRRRKSTSSRI